MKLLKSSAAVTLAVVFAGMSSGVAAQDTTEVAPGTVITSSNIDELKKGTFQGYPVADLLSEKIEWQVREWNLTLPLVAPKPIPRDPRLLEATERYSASVQYDPATKMVTGYKAGVPFPNIDMNDPHSGAKVVWNFTYSQPRADVQDLSKFAFLLIDGETGLERRQFWGYLRYYMKGLVRDTNNPVEGDGTILDKLLLWAWYPQDIRGLGTFTLRYDTGKLPDVWAYVRTVRRVRRLSGGPWMDPIGGTDQLQDDIEIFNAHPSWYQSYKILEKRPILYVANSLKPTWVEDAADPIQQHPRVDLENPPYWNPVDNWEPREVYVVESIPPAEHPYSKKIFYVDAGNWRPIFGEMYDKKGEFWKFQNFASWPLKTEDGGSAVLSAWGQTADFQRRHATIFQSHDSWRVNPPDVTAQEVTLNQLEAGGR